MKKIKAKKKPQDSTLRNVQAANRRIDKLERRIEAWTNTLSFRIANLERLLKLR